MSVLPSLYAITDRQISNLSNEEIIRQMLAGGARLIQLRDKQGTARDIFDAVRSCLPLVRAAGGRLIINDRVDVVLTSDADGVHLGQEDLSVEEAREILGPEKMIGVSTHNREQFEAALETTADYIAVGPIFGTTTKENPDPVVGLDLLRELRGLTERPIVAIGGISAERARAVLAAGANSVAAISALCPWPEKLELTSQVDIVGGVRRFLAALEEAQEPEG